MNPKDWDACWRYGIGIEHKLSKQWSILAGYVFDESPIPDSTMDFTVPTGDRHRGSIGFKYRFKENHEIVKRGPLFLIFRNCVFCKKTIVNYKYWCMLRICYAGIDGSLIYSFFHDEDKGGRDKLGGTLHGDSGTFCGSRQL